MKNKYGDEVNPDGSIKGADPCPVPACKTPLPRWRMPDRLIKCGQNHRLEA